MHNYLMATWYIPSNLVSFFLLINSGLSISLLYLFFWSDISMVMRSLSSLLFQLPPLLEENMVWTALTRASNENITMSTIDNNSSTKGKWSWYCCVITSSMKDNTGFCTYITCVSQSINKIKTISTTVAEEIYGNFPIDYGKLHQ